MILNRQLIVLLMALASMALSAATATATPGGATPDAVSVPGSPETVVRIGNPLLSASANGISIAAHATALLRGRVRIDGSAPTGTSGSVSVERLDPRLGWIGVTVAPVAKDGSFHALWRPHRVGAIQLRAVVGGSASGDSGSGSGATSAGLETDPDPTAPQLSVTVYRSGVASWYGGPRTKETSTACGVTLGATTLGVAHRTLPCGTLVALYRRGRTLVVPVIDRGPFVRGRSWDLTYATFRALGGTDGLVTLGALPLLPPAPAPLAGG